MTGHFRKKAALVSAAFCLLGVAACASVDPSAGSRQSVERWAKERQFDAMILNAGAFELLALERRSGPGEQLVVYIEGDGAAWRTPFHPPADPSRAVVYLARPCQYLAPQALDNCSPVWWTTRRFSSAVVVAYEQALDTLKARSGATTLRLVGYSGGGVIAALLAMRRPDVVTLITVASPLALGEWTRVHGVSALNNALDPVLQAGPLPPATHWAGTDDTIVPFSVIERFAQTKGGTVRLVNGYDHDCCWTNAWKQQLKESP